ncbi:MAG: hypothetical protein JSU05_06200 [Bacteroidetes bacterium]|nr:hypothetical protein [Bacteroidota bacterium]
MKKMMMALVLIAVMITSTASANEENVTPQVLTAFKNDFSSAKEVNWTINANYYKAAFVFNSQHVFAFYDKNGELIGITRYIKTSQLPIQLQADLKNNYSDFWVTDLFELANNDGQSYYITLENADKTVVLKSDNGTDWTVFKKTKKA